MARLTCPVPTCSRRSFARQKTVKSHLREDRDIAIPLGKGGNMGALRAHQQNYFLDWLESQGYDYNFDLFENRVIPMQSRTTSNTATDPTTMNLAGTNNTTSNGITTNSGGANDASTITADSILIQATIPPRKKKCRLSYATCLKRYMPGTPKANSRMLLTTMRCSRGGGGGRETMRRDGCS